MRSKIARFLSAHLSPGDRVIVAVSGGKDSMALLHAVWSLAPVQGFLCTAAHFNHQLRGEASRQDELFVREYCQHAGIPLEVGSGDVSGYAAAHHMGIEEAARTLRYAFLTQLSPDAKILTAHTAQDNAETLMMHLIRGTGLHGLTGIPPVRENILRPMLTVTTREILDYLETNHIPHVEDATNALDDCLRNRVRHHLLPLLEQENPAVMEALSALTEELRQVDDYLDRQTASARLALTETGRLSRTGLLQTPPALQYRVLAAFLSEVPQLTRRHLEDAISLCRSASPSGMLSLPGGYCLRLVYDALELTIPEAQVLPPDKQIEPGMTVVFGRWIVTCSRGPMPAVLPPGTVALARDAISGPLTLRVRQPGDRLRLPGGTKKLSRYLIDRKVPAHLRDSLPVVCVKDTVVAVLPLCAADPFRPGQEGRDSYLLSAKRMEEENE